MTRSSLTKANSLDDVLAYGKWDVHFDDDNELGGLILAPEEVHHVLSLTGALWQHNGDPKAPHAMLRSGKHSDGFIAVTEALKYATINSLFAVSLVNKINRQNLGHIDWVVGSDHAAATFSYAVAQRFMIEWINRDLKHNFSEKVVEGGGEKQKWSRHTIGKDERVLQIEELCTTNLTLSRVRYGIAEAHPDYPITYIPIIGMAVNRTGSDNFEESSVVSLLDITFNEYDVKNGKQCPLCAGGSEPLENVKKDVATWAKLNCR